MTNATGEHNLALAQEALEVFLEIACKERRKHMMINNPQMENVGKCIISNHKSQLGVMAVRGYTYAGSKGVMLRPIKDMAHTSHGPISCDQYSCVGRRNYYTGISGVGNFDTLNFASDSQERDIAFGSDRELTKLIKEMRQLFSPTKGITTRSEYPVGLIGGDINAVANASSGALDKPVIPVRCEGSHGVLRSLDHCVVGDTVRDWVLDSREGQPFASTPYDVTIIGNYDIGGGTWASCILLEEIGLRLVAQRSGGGTLIEMESTPFVKLSLTHCCRSMNHVTRHMEEKHQIPWVEYNFSGPTKIAGSLRKVVSQFDDTIRANTEVVVARYKEQMAVIIAKYRPWLEGRKMLLCMGGLQSRHVIGAYENLGVKIIAAGYEFAHNDDYDRILSGLKEGTLLPDDTSNYELEAFIKALRPDPVGSGIKKKYISQKIGVLLRQMHSWSYSGPYHGYNGFAVFARDMDMALNNPAWNKLTVPRLKPT